MPFTVFVSYSHEDVQLVEPIVRLLRATEGLVFRDVDSIRGGQKWRDEIVSAINGATLVAVFWCVHSRDSSEVKSEYTLAISAGKDVLPVLLDSTPIPSEMSQFQWIDFRALGGSGHSEPPARRLAKAAQAARVVFIAVVAAAVFRPIFTQQDWTIWPLLSVVTLAGLTTLVIMYLRRDRRRRAEASRATLEQHLLTGLSTELLRRVRRALPDPPFFVIETVSVRGTGVICTRRNGTTHLAVFTRGEPFADNSVWCYGDYLGGWTGLKAVGLSGWRDVEEYLLPLGDLGVVHVEINPDVSTFEMPRGGDAVDARFAGLPIVTTSPRLRVGTGNAKAILAMREIRAMTRY